MKNIAMRCNQSQFDAIKPILEYNNKKILKVIDFNRFPYLANVEGAIFNIKYPLNAKGEWIDGTERNTYEEWNPFLFLESCEIKNVGYSIKITDANAFLLSEYFKIDRINFDYDLYLNYENNKTWFSYEPHLCFLQINTETFKKYIMNNNQENDHTITIQQLLEIYQVACPEWRKILTKQYFPKVESNGNILITNEEIKTMFEASNSNQIKVLESIFGVQQETIEFDKLKTGSVIKLRRNCFGNTFDYDKPIFIIFRNNGYAMNNQIVTQISSKQTTIMQAGVFYNNDSSHIDEEIIKVEKY
jgi:hypothetical protein